MSSQEQGKQLSIAEAMHLAEDYQQAGQLQQSEILLRQILNQNPNHPAALHLLGVIAFQVGQTEMALGLIEKAISIDDKVALFHSNYGEMCRMNKRLEQAVEHGKKAVALEPSVATTHSNLGVAYFDLKEFDLAQACQMRALSLDPDFVPALNNMGSIFRERKMFIEALNYYEKAFNASDRKNPEPLCNLGTVLLEEERVDEAIPFLMQSLEMQPNNTEALCSLGGAFLAREESEKAYAYFSKALSISPNHANSLAGLGRVFQDGSRFEKSLECFNKAIEIDPTKDSFYLHRAVTYQDLERVQEAIADFDKSFELDTTKTIALVAKARLFVELHDMESANQVYKQALSVDPKDISTLSQFTLTYKVKKDDANLATLIDIYESGEPTKVNDRLTLHFALGKCFEDVGEYDKAFFHLSEGNRLKRKLFDYEATSETEVVNNLINTFSKEYISRCEGSGNATDTPVFIVGMPRSGTTLVEQIISSHPSVYGAGELHYLPMLTSEAVNHFNMVSVPNMLKSLTPEIINYIADQYLMHIRTLNQKALRICDKMPNNYYNIGLIHLIFPNAKIIHLKRNPLDVCLSGFSRVFLRGQHQSYDLVEQGKYYRDYARLMQHWRAALPEGSFFEIQYENLIEDTETFARQLIDYCGLDWREECLAFHESNRRVKTASIMQVRQPIYKTSVEKWRRYEKHLGPLREALGEFNPE